MANVALLPKIQRTSQAEYESAQAVLATIEKMKAAHRALLLRMLDTPEGRDLCLTERDVRAALAGLDEDIDEMCWRPKRDAKEVIQDHDTLERLEHEYAESTHYGRPSWGK